ncbi:hypothetical protein Taro_036085, partial [Colocasia esculenta]|nr:hypothetical protein [Colocasia esculenta]
VGYGSVLVFSVLDISSELASRVGYGSVLVFNVLDISSELASRCVTSTECWRQWCCR